MDATNKTTDTTKKTPVKDAAEKLKAVTREKTEEVQTVTKEKAEEVKAATKEKAEEVKAATKEKAEEVKEKAAEKKTAARTRKTAASKAKTTKAKSPAKRTARKKKAEETVILQYYGTDVNVQDLKERAIAQFNAAAGNETVHKIALYLKPEDRAAYYVINDEHAGRVDF